jgi:Arc-like DNA binding domain
MPERPADDAPALSSAGHDETPANVQLKVRLKEPLRAALEEAATRRGHSMNAEVVNRLQGTFDQDARLGGPVMLAMVNLMAGAFLRGGQLGARARGHPEWTPSEWMNDSLCYRIAVHTVQDALLAVEPKPVDEDRYSRYKAARGEQDE